MRYINQYNGAQLIKNVFILYVWGVQQVAWVQVNTQTILTIHTKIISRNPRVGLSQSSHRQWYLRLKNVEPGDRGWYMCQINTDPMMQQVGL